MRRFIYKCLIFAAPFLAAALFVVLVDPYNYFNVSPLIANQHKIKFSRKLQMCLWKAIEYRRQPCANVLFGDSRTFFLDVERIAAVSGEPYYNFAYGGGTVPEMIASFWFAARHASLKRVYFGINFNLYNACVAMNRFAEAQRVLDQPARYFVEKKVWQSSYYLLAAQVLHRTFAATGGSKEALWQLKLVVETRAFYQTYIYPQWYYQELQRIAGYCRAHGIAMAFIINPTHVELQQQVAAFGLERQRERFVQDLRSLAPVYDFDFVNAYTSDRDHFSDPYHYTDPAVVISGVWGGERTFVRVGGGVIR
jgi:hypothetical protein